MKPTNTQVLHSLLGLCRLLTVYWVLSCPVFKKKWVIFVCVYFHIFLSIFRTGQTTGTTDLMIMKEGSEAHPVTFSSPLEVQLLSKLSNTR